MLKSLASVELSNSSNVSFLNFVDMGCGVAAYINIALNTCRFVYLLQFDLLLISSYLTLLIATSSRYYGWKEYQLVNLANRIKFCSRPGSSACNLEAGTCGACIHSTPEACLSTPHIFFFFCQTKWRSIFESGAGFGAAKMTNIIK